MPETERFQDEAHADRQFVGGPAQIGATTLHVVIRASESMGPALILETGLHTALMPELIVDGNLAPANSSAYHGGTLSDELAALIALELGVRLRVAGTRLLSGIHDGSTSLPIHLEVLPLARPGRPGREVLPRVAQRDTSIDRLSRVKRFPELAEKTAIDLVRAAREYAAAIWWANEDPDQGWLHLVAAVEIAAAGRQRVSADAANLVRALWPELWGAVEGADSATQEAVARQVAGQMRATRRFVDFIAELAPPPPEPRPKWGELDWNAMRGHARTIYGHRSSALHAGKPYPIPMREAPRADEQGALQEAPWGLTSGGPGAIWARDETPMLLSTFEYIVRGALLSWWDELIQAAPGSSETRGRHASE